MGVSSASISFGRSMFASRSSQSVSFAGHFVLVGDGEEHDPESVEVHFGYDISGALKE